MKAINVRYFVTSFMFFTFLNNNRVNTNYGESMSLEDSNILKSVCSLLKFEKLL